MCSQEYDSSAVRWLLEPEVFEEDSQLVIDALEKLNVNYDVCTFGRDYEEYLVNSNVLENVMFYGSLRFACLIERQTQWLPGVYCNLEQLECTYYYAELGQYLLNSQYIMLPYGELKRNAQWLLDTVGINGKLFLRPSSGYKTFTGQIVDSASINFVGVRCDPNAIVIASKPIEIDREWRLVVLEDKIIGATQYKEKGEVVRIAGAPAEVIEYGAEIVRSNPRYQPDPAWILDICQANNELKVLEVGSFSCSGLYACDTVPIIEAVNQKITNPYWD